MKKKTFKNKTERMHYLLHPREIEREINSNGITYRIYDDGNYIFGHIFSVEKLLCKQNGIEYFDRVSEVFIDWSEVYNIFKEFINGTK